MPNRQKVGETRPENNFSEPVALECGCNRPYIIQKPLCRIEITPRFYSEFCYTCLNCNWNSIKFRTRTT